MKNKKYQFKGIIILLIAAFIWGSTFVAQRLGAMVMGPFTFLFWRSLTACAFLYPLSFIIKCYNKTPFIKKTKNYFPIILLLFLCGLSLFIASFLQQIGLKTTTAGKSGFLTSLYILFVPLLGLLLHKKVTPRIWIGILIACIGSFLLSYDGGFTIRIGDLFTIISAVFFAVQILCIEKLNTNVSSFFICSIQFTIVTIFSFIAMMVLENPSINELSKGWGAILYAGILSSGIAYTCQIIGQKSTNVNVSALLMSLESVFSLICGIIILDESLSILQFSGCILIFCGVIFAQLRFYRR